jgi:hypothetical protein
MIVSVFMVISFVSTGCDHRTRSADARENALICRFALFPREQVRRQFEQREMAGLGVAQKQTERARQVL